MPLRSRLSYAACCVRARAAAAAGFSSERLRNGAAAPPVGPLMRSAHAKCHCGLGSHMRHVRGRGQLQLLVSRAKDCVMALLRRLLALSCDRHMRNATAVSALICGMCEGEGSCSCWSLERETA